MDRTIKLYTGSWFHNRVAEKDKEIKELRYQLDESIKSLDDLIIASNEILKTRIYERNNTGTR